MVVGVLHPILRVHCLAAGVVGSDGSVMTSEASVVASGSIMLGSEGGVIASVVSVMA